MSVGDFIARKSELAVLENRSLNSGESTALVSELPSGRTTLLRELQRRLPASGCHLAFIDVQAMDAGTTPDRFWAAVVQQFGGGRTGGVSGTSFRALERLVARPPRHVLLIRDLPGLVHFPAFRSSDPWGKLRALTQSHHFSLVASSRIDLVALTAEVQDWMQGSPFFNALREMVLGPLNPVDAAGYLEHHYPRLRTPEHEWILRCTGGHPKMLVLLGEALEQSTSAGLKGTDARRTALGRCRQEVRLMLHNAWLFFPWQERWILLSTALAQWCEVEFWRPIAASQAAHGVTPTHNELLYLIETRLHRDNLRRMLLDVVPVQDLAALPGEQVSNQAYFMEAVDLLFRRLAVAPFLERVRIWELEQANMARPASHGWGVSRASGAPWQPTTEIADRLIPRGVLEQTSRLPGFQVTPPLFYWWILDQLQALAIGDVHAWLTLHGLERHVSPQTVQALRTHVLECGPLVRHGTTPLLDAESQ